MSFPTVYYITQVIPSCYSAGYAMCVCVSFGACVYRSLDTPHQCYSLCVPCVCIIVYAQQCIFIPLTISFYHRHVVTIKIETECNSKLVCPGLPGLIKLAENIQSDLHVLNVLLLISHHLYLYYESELIFYHLPFVYNAYQYHI